MELSSWLLSLMLSATRPSGSQALGALLGTQKADGTLSSGSLVREDHNIS